MKFWPVQSDV